MAERFAIWGIFFVFLLSITVSMIEYFIPLSAKYDMNTACRATLLKMEIQGGLTDPEKANLINSLSNRRFSSITVTGTISAKQGDRITLSVETDYSYSKLTFLSRSNVIQHMVYNKSSIERMVTN